MVVPFPPGGGNDLMARLLGPPLGVALGQSIVVDNRPGGGANIGAEVVAKAAPDGYVVLMGAVVHAVNATLYGKLGYNLLQDFAPVSLLASTPNILVVHPSVPARSVKELIALARVRPGQLDFASAGSGSSPHLAGALFNVMSGVTLNHIPYKGSAPAMVALISGECAIAFVSAPSVIQHVRSGRLRAIAVTGEQRLPMVPDLPTIGESGVPGYAAGGWFGLLLPKGAPAEVIGRLQTESAKVLRAPDMQERMDANGLTVVAGTPDAFAAYLRAEVAKWGNVVRTAGMRVE
jgi:tripartite-type tricarboxylate transporter receptor subunit TctC